MVINEVKVRNEFFKIIHGELGKMALLFIFIFVIFLRDLTI